MGYTKNVKKQFKQAIRQIAFLGERTEVLLHKVGILCDELEKSNQRIDILQGKIDQILDNNYKIINEVEDSHINVSKIKNNVDKMAENTEKHMMHIEDIIPNKPIYWSNEYERAIVNSNWNEGGGRRCDRTTRFRRKVCAAYQRFSRRKHFDNYTDFDTTGNIFS